MTASRPAVYFPGRHPGHHARRHRAATMLQARFRGRKARKVTRKRGQLAKKNVAAKQDQFRTEIKFMEDSAVTTIALQPNAASAADGLKNSLTIVPPAFVLNADRGVGDSDVIGSWIRYAYPTKLKVLIDWSTLITTHPDAAKGFNWQCHQVLIKNTFKKAGLSPSLAHAVNIVKDTTFESHLTASHLSFTKQNRQVQVLRSFRIQPRLFNRTFATDLLQASSADYAPVTTLSFSWNMKKDKTRLVVHDGSKYSPNELWIPAVIISCDQISANTSGPTISYLSKCWYTDC